jgi:hypothetical protein
MLRLERQGASVPGMGMLEEFSDPARELPNNPAGLRGVREWFFGRREYAHPALRWMANPLLLLSGLLASVNTLGEFRGPVLPTLCSALFVVSLTTRGSSYRILRQRRRKSQLDPFGRL